MKPLLKELSEILKTNPAIKERWKIEISEKWFLKEAPENIDEIIDGIIPLSIGYHDILEYLGDEDYCLYHGGIGYLGGIIITLSPGALSDQTDETLDEIISLCKNVGNK